MPKNLIITIFIVAVLIFYIFIKLVENQKENTLIPEYENATRNVESPSSTHIRIKDQTLNVEIARTIEEKRLGLMHREAIPQNQGMLFLYNKEDAYSFWMKNMLIPLDIIWISADQNIVYIAKNVQPCTTTNCESYRPDKLAKYVLEVNAGWTNTHNISVGDSVELNL